jgi:hypothetical protein
MKVAHKAVNVPVSHKKPETPEKAKRMGKKNSKARKTIAPSIPFATKYAIGYISKNSSSISNIQH